MPKETTFASNPGGIKLKSLVYARYFPETPLRLLLGSMTTLGGIAGVVATKGGSALVLVFSLRFTLEAYRRMKSVARHFRSGCALPGIVVNTEPYTVASITDLSTGGGMKYLAVRILPHALQKVPGRKYATGDRVPCVALYSGQMPTPKWDNFNPVPAVFATNDAAELARVEASISEEDWIELNEALFYVPKPYRNGLFQIAEMSQPG